MRISFDIDDTLICIMPDVPREPDCVPRFLRHWYNEPLRLGAKALMSELAQQGHSLWIYTTSGRTPGYLTRWFRFYGIPIAEVVNQQKHERIVKLEAFRYRPSKYPPSFGIDVHIDDSEGVAMEGQEHGFRTIVVSINDPDWANHVRASLAAIIAQQARQA